MERAELEELKNKVTCAAVLEREGFALDVKESTRKAMKYRRDGAIIIVIHGGKGWFDPLSDGKGDIFSLVERLKGCAFSEARHEVAELVGFVPSSPVWQRASRGGVSDRPIAKRWQARRQPWHGSMSWRYLHDVRHLPESVIQAAIAADLLREGPHGSMWAAHSGAEGALTGWEERGPDWRGFATGGAKVLFGLGLRNASRICVTEAAIDAMSLAALEGLRPDSLYLSTGGGWSPSTAAALGAVAARPGVHLVAATDNNAQGEIYAGRLLGLAEEAGCSAERLRPITDDWNADLEKRQQETERKAARVRLPHALRSPQG
jgi:subtilisin family serine protease